MALESFKKALSDLKISLNHLKNRPSDSSIKSFKSTQFEYHRSLAGSSLSKLDSLIFDLYKLKIDKRLVDEISLLVDDIDKNYKNNKINDSISSVNKINNLLNNIHINENETKSEISFKIPKLPDEIRADVSADILEMQKCYKAELFRSAAILCGRILEIALHRKYFEVTETDILEKHPEIGLGNLIAKLVEKGVHFDPGLTQQIHLINQVRVHSVHKKQEVFIPSKMQTQAMILYTMDALEKLFRS